MRSILALVLVTLILTVLHAPHAAAQVCGQWEPLSITDLQPGVNGTVRAMAVYDDGSGSAVYLAGNFRVDSPDAPRETNLAAWRNGQFVPIPITPGAGSETAWALAVFDDGGGEALYIAASSRIVRLRQGVLTTVGVCGAGWPHALVAGVENGAPVLYAAGTFASIDGTPAARAARWDGSTWSALGTGLNGTVRAAAMFDDGSGPALHVGGEFSTAGGVAAGRVARWKDGQWNPLGAGMGGSLPVVHTLLPGPGTLYAGGAFSTAGGVPAANVAAWDGHQWAPLGSGGPGTAFTMAWHDEGNGARLFVGGWLTAPAGLSEWDGASWTARMPEQACGYSSGPTLHALASLDDGEGARLYLGGDFSVVGGIQSRGVARYRAGAFEPAPPGAYARIHRLAVADDGSGPRLFIGGDFVTLGGVQVNNIARWNGAGWTACGEGVRGVVQAITSADVGDGPSVFVGGCFGRAGGAPASNIAQWDGEQWTPLGAGISLADSNTSPPGVRALAARQQGGSAELFAAGAFGSSGGLPNSSHLARWNGSNWSNVQNPAGTWFGVMTAASSVALNSVFIAKWSTFSIGTSGETSVARWNGTAWSGLGTVSPTTIRAMMVHDVGHGERLYAAGLFTTADGVATGNIAEWSENGWAALGGAQTQSLIADLAGGTASFDRGLYVASPSSLRRWDGAAWAALPAVTSGLPGITRCAYFDDGTGPALYLSGSYSEIGGLPAANLARFKLCVPCYANCDQSLALPTLNVADFTCFLQKFAAADPYANCDESTEPPVLNVADFTCFLQKFAAGCE